MCLSLRASLEEWTQCFLKVVKSIHCCCFFNIGIIHIILSEIYYKNDVNSINESGLTDQLLDKQNIMNQDLIYWVLIPVVPSSHWQHRPPLDTPVTTKHWRADHKAKHNTIQKNPFSSDNNRQDEDHRRSQQSQTSRDYNLILLFEIRQKNIRIIYSGSNEGGGADRPSNPPSSAEQRPHTSKTSTKDTDHQLDDGLTSCFDPAVETPSRWRLLA